MKKHVLLLPKNKPTVKKVKKSKSILRNIFEVLILLIWLAFTGAVGYYFGQAGAIDCSLQSHPVSQAQSFQSIACTDDKPGSGVAIGAIDKSDGFTYKELSKMWTCSQATYNFTQGGQQILPREGTLDKTKWKSILSVEPKLFFDTYLTQYPRDVRAVQPVVIFSHKPLNNSNDITEVCKVLDIAIVPDTPGLCVAVTETFHDVASYHMLHAEKQNDGTFTLTNNHIHGRVLPNEAEYAHARYLLLQYFKHVQEVDRAVKRCPRYDGGRVTISIFIGNNDEVMLFKNSYHAARRRNISPTKYCIFTTSEDLAKAVQSTDRALTVVNLPFLNTILNEPDKPLNTYFIQAWIAFSVAQSGIKALWQSPGTLWLGGKPDDVVNLAPISETVWAYKGRKDPKAAPFFISFDFFTVTSNERPVHLLHEMMLHFDLVIAWDSFDSVLAYRLSENNARYGTPSYLWPPYQVLHTDLLAGDPLKIKEAQVDKKAAPMVVIFPRQGRSAGDTIQLLKESELWFL